MHIDFMKMDAVRTQPCMIQLCSGITQTCIKYKDKDKDKDVFIGPKEFVSHMMMTQTKYRLYHQLR